MDNYLCHISCGETIPFNNPHAVSVSLPTLTDVIGYEEGNLAVIEKMKSGYPRFFKNQFVRELECYFRKKHLISNETLVFSLPSLQAFNILCYLLEEELDYIILEEIYFVLVPKNHKKGVVLKQYVQNVGLIVSSRQAEQILYDLFLLNKMYKEQRQEYSSGLQSLLGVLSEAYGVAKSSIVLAANGANAMFAVCEAVLSQNNSQKKGVIQLGWLYLDTMEILKKRGQEVFTLTNMLDLEALEYCLQQHHDKIGLVVSEIVSNPKLECLDIAKVYTICKRYNVIFVLDATLSTPYHVDVMAHCDVAVESLSKFACGNADVLMGAIVCKHPELVPHISNFVVSPFVSDVERLAVQIINYKHRLEIISNNTKQLIAYFSTHSKIKNVLSVYAEGTKENYAKIAKSEAIPGLISVVFSKNLDCYYDALPFAKGPSLGTQFTLIMPYVYLAHYDLIQSAAGRDCLNKNGIEIALLRISVGVEPINTLISLFDIVLNKQ